MAKGVVFSPSTGRKLLELSRKSKSNSLERDLFAAPPSRPLELRAYLVQPLTTIPGRTIDGDGLLSLGAGGPCYILRLKKSYDDSDLPDVIYQRDIDGEKVLRTVYNLCTDSIPGSYYDIETGEGEGSGSGDDIFQGIAFACSDCFGNLFIVEKCISGSSYVTIDGLSSGTDVISTRSIGDAPYQVPLTALSYPLIDPPSWLSFSSNNVILQPGIYKLRGNGTFEPNYGLGSPVVIADAFRYTGMFLYTTGTTVFQYGAEGITSYGGFYTKPNCQCCETWFDPQFFGATAEIQSVDYDATIIAVTAATVGLYVMVDHKGSPSTGAKMIDGTMTIEKIG